MENPKEDQYEQDELEEIGDEEEIEDSITALSERIAKLESEERRSTGLGLWALGMMIAVVASWSRNASILWCIMHGLLSWIYVIYFAVTRH